MRQSAAPAGDPSMGPMLLSHMSAANAAKYGISGQAEAVANDKHALYLIAEAGDEEHVSQFQGIVASGLAYRDPEP